MHTYVDMVWLTYNCLMFEREVIIHLKFAISESKWIMASILTSVQERKKNSRHENDRQEVK